MYDQDWLKQMLDAQEKKAADALIKSDDDHAVYNHARQNGLNGTLALRQKLTITRVNEIKKFHVARNGLFHAAELLAEQGRYEEVRLLQDAMHEVEFKLQELWGFDKDKDRHTFWYRLPHCACPKMDQMPGRHTINLNCPIHGDK